MKHETLKRLDQLNIYRQICIHELETNFGSIHDGLFSSASWKIPNQRRTRRILRRSLKRYGEEKDVFDFYFPEETLNVYVEAVLEYGEEKMLMERAHSHRCWFELWRLRDLTKYLKGYAKDYCLVLCDMAELALSASDIIDE